LEIKRFATTTVIIRDKTGVLARVFVKVIKLCPIKRLEVHWGMVKEI